MDIFVPTSHLTLIKSPTAHKATTVIVSALARYAPPIPSREPFLYIPNRATVVVELFKYNLKPN